uniref:TonB-dependent receptor n=1 Tax=Roseihalotalea indica TaxID=2867963 RepID=A0AA49GUP0_9BACT|nr:TonB-dependent receptor [Tunicatimonas sp. TK19036]
MMNPLQIYVKLWLLTIFCSLCSQLPAQELAALPPLTGPSSHQTDNPGQDETTKSLKSVLSEIESQYDVFFSYDINTVEDKVVKAPSSDSWSDLSIDQLLTSFLKPFQLRYKKIEDGYYIIFSEKKELKRINSEKLQSTTNNRSFSQPIASLASQGIDEQADLNKTITGKVTDENSDPMPGVNILVKNSTIGTVTDVGGNYRLNAPDTTTTLVFSSIGYATEEVMLGGRTVIDLQMSPDIKALSEVVVVGYGTQEKRDVTGAIASVNSEDIQKIPVTSFDQALQGQVPGVSITQNSGAPGGNVSVRIRGIGTPGSSNEPLYVIDGFPIMNDNLGTSFYNQSNNPLAALNPNDIESIEVLKDASASAIYGSRAANGVVIITTKRGTAGQMKVNFDAYYGLQQATNLPEMLNPMEFATLANEAIINEDFPFPLNPEWSDPASLGTEGTDWLGALFRTAPMQSYNLGVSGGNQLIQGAVSLNYFNQDGIVLGSGFDRFSVRANVDLNVSERFKLGNSLTVSRTITEGVPTNDATHGLITQALARLPTLPIYNDDGSFAGTYGSPTYYSNLDNPIARAHEIENTINKSRVLGTVFAEYTILPGLNWKTNVGADMSFANGSNYLPAVLDRGLYTLQQTAELSVYSHEGLDWVIENTLTYDKSFGSHSLTGLVGYTSQKFDRNYLSSSGNTFVNETIRGLDGSLVDNRTTGGHIVESTLVSYLGRINYSYDDTYLFTASIRRDGSSTFGPDNKWGVFPSFSAGVRLSELGFMQSVSFLDDLKLRGSWGQIGNQSGLSPGSYNTSLSNSNVGHVFGQEPGVGSPGVALQQIGNPALRWETTTQTDFGIDASFFEGKMLLTADYYIKDTEDLLINVPVPATVGSPRSPAVNAGEVRNEGLELALTYRKYSGSFNYSLSGNISFYNNEVLGLGPDGEQIIYGDYKNRTYSKTAKGLPIGSMYGFVMDGIFQNEAEVEAHADQPNAEPGFFRFRDLNDDDVINDEDRTIIGNPFPDFTYGLTGNFSYKSFDLNLFIQGVQGNDVYNRIKSELYDIQGFNNAKQDLMNRWHGEGTSNTIPKLSLAGNNNPNFSPTHSWYVEDGSFVRLRNVQLGYTLPQTVAENAGLSSARVYIGAQNLFTLTKYSGIDPEVGDLNQNVLKSGYDDGNYPQARVFRLGVSLGF